MLVMGRSLLWLGQEYTARVHHCEKSGPSESGVLMGESRARLSALI
jgi:hypothetical protein